MKNTRERIRMLEREEVSSPVRAIYDEMLALRGAIPNMFKTLAHTPELAAGVAAFLKPLMADGALAGWYKELVATRVALLNLCDY